MKLEDKVGIGVAVAQSLMCVAFFAWLWWYGSTFDERMRKAHEAGVAEAERKAEAHGGWEAYTRKSVNSWCAKNGKPLSYPEYGTLEDE